MNANNPYTSNDSQASGIGDCGSKLGASCNVHASQEDRLLDLQEIGECGLDLLWGSHLVCIEGVDSELQERGRDGISEDVADRADRKRQRDTMG